MQIYKFGGASVKDAAAVRNVVQVIKATQPKELGIVVSAMGKTTNALEHIIELYQSNNTDYLKKIDVLLDFHLNIIHDLINDQNYVDEGLRFRESGIINTIKGIIESLKGDLLRNQSKNYSFLYDQVVSHGEILSTRIVSAYLNACDIPVVWLDARKMIKTNQKYRDAAVDWKKTVTSINEHTDGNNFITQGFIGSDENGLTTTLGREGSDYTAAILAYALDASDVTIWKDVPGVLNGDPRVFENTVLLEQISYSEAIELAFYGASVIHPKTLQPLQGKDIPLKVKSFINPLDKGTTITKGQSLVPMTSCYIVRKNLNLLKVSARDFSFIGEDNVSDIFHQLSTHKMQVGLIQNSAISFTLCIEDKYKRIEELLLDLEEKYIVSCISDVSLYTVRHQNDDSLNFLNGNDEVLLKQRTQETLQLVVRQ